MHRFAGTLPVIPESLMRKSTARRGQENKYNKIDVYKRSNTKYKYVYVEGRKSRMHATVTYTSRYEHPLTQIALVQFHRDNARQKVALHI